MGHLVKHFCRIAMGRCCLKKPGTGEKKGALNVGPLLLFSLVMRLIVAQLDPTSYDFHNYKYYVLNQQNSWSIYYHQTNH